MKDHAVTIKKTRNPITQKHYLDHLDILNKTVGKVGNVAFETTRGLHCHFTIKTDGKLNYQNLKPEKYGWNAKAVPIYNKVGWVSYCRKDYKENKELNSQPESLYPNQFHKKHKSLFKHI